MPRKEPQQFGELLSFTRTKFCVCQDGWQSLVPLLPAREAVLLPRAKEQESKMLSGMHTEKDREILQMISGHVCLHVLLMAHPYSV